MNKGKSPIEKTYNPVFCVWGRLGPAQGGGERRGASVAYVRVLMIEEQHTYTAGSAPAPS